MAGHKEIYIRVMVGHTNLLDLLIALTQKAPTRKKKKKKVKGNCTDQEDFNWMIYHSSSIFIFSEINFTCFQGIIYIDIHMLH